MYREFVYSGDPPPELKGEEYEAFLMNIQRSVLFSLEQRKLLSPEQRKRCLAELERRGSNGPV